MKMSLSSQLPQNTRGSSNDGTDSEKKGGILLQGYLRKLKRMKKKYFILFDESESTPSRLEYFDSEKKWKSGQGPKRYSEFTFPCFCPKRAHISLLVGQSQSSHASTSTGVQTANINSL